MLPSLRTNDGINNPALALWRRLLEMDKPLPAQSAEDLAAEVERNYPWNFRVNFLDGVAFWFGSSFISSSTIAPLFISKLTLNPLIIGLVAMIAQAGWYLPQLFVADQTERIARKKVLVVNLGFFLERLPAFLWPLAALAAFQSPALAMFLFFLGYAWHGLGAGVVGPAWQVLIANCFPLDRRGRFMGLTMAFGGAVGAGGALLSSYLLKTISFPYNFVCVFLIAAVCINLSWFFLALTREPIHPAQIAAGPATEPIWLKIGQILRQDQNFSRFLLARMAVALTGMGTGFITVAAIQRWQVADSTVAFYTIALLAGQAGGNLLAGFLADRFGHKLSVEMGAMAAALAFGLAWLAPSALWYYGVFVLVGMTMGTMNVSGILITLEFSNPAQRPTYIGMVNSLVGITGIVSPLLGGWLGSVSYSLLFAITAVIGLVAMALLRWYVKEPRTQPAN